MTLTVKSSGPGASGLPTLPLTVLSFAVLSVAVLLRRPLRSTRLAIHELFGLASKLCFLMP